MVWVADLWMYIILLWRVMQLTGQWALCLQSERVYDVLPPRDPARDLTGATFSGGKRDNKINSHFLNNGRKMTQRHTDTRNKPFEYKNDIVLLIFEYKMNKYILS